jgi:hypothetical protein
MGDSTKRASMGGNGWDVVEKRSGKEEKRP